MYEFTDLMNDSSVRILNIYSYIQTITSFFTTNDEVSYYDVISGNRNEIELET